jgi:hypothetical protein
MGNHHFSRKNQREIAVVARKIRRKLPACSQPLRSLFCVNLRSVSLSSGMRYQSMDVVAIAVPLS